jgi:hypothetical protein
MSISSTRTFVPMFSEARQDRINTSSRLFQVSKSLDELGRPEDRWPRESLRQSAPKSTRSLELLVCQADAEAKGNKPPGDIHGAAQNPHCAPRTSCFAILAANCANPRANHALLRAARTSPSTFGTVLRRACDVIVLRLLCVFIVRYIRRVLLESTGALRLHSANLPDSKRQ